MKPLHIDFVAANGAGHRAAWRVCLLLAAAGLLLTALLIVAGNGLSQEATALRTRAEDMSLERDALRSAAQHQEQIAPEMADAINGVIRMLDYPLIGLLEQLEHHARPNIAVMSAEMGPVRSNIRIIVQAASLPEALDYLEDLRREPAFRNLSLTRQEASGGEGQGWRFTLEMPQTDAVPRAVSRNPNRGQE